MRRGGGKDEAPDKVMGPLFPRLHVNDTVKGGPRAPPRNKMALYEQFSVPSHRFAATAPAPAPPWHANRPAAGAPASSTPASQVGGNDRPLFPLFCVPSTEPVRSSDHMNVNSNGRAGVATRAESGRQSTQRKSKDNYAAGLTVECSSQHKDNNNKNLSGKKLTNDDDFTVPSVLYSGMPPHSTQEKVGIQEKFTPFPTTSPCKNGSTMSKSYAEYSSADKRHLEEMNVSDAESRESASSKEKEPAKSTRDMGIDERTSSFQTSKEKLGRSDPKVSSYRDRLSNFNVADKQHSETEGCQTQSRKEDAIETQNPRKNGTLPSSEPYSDMEQNGHPNLLEHGLRDTGEKRKRSHHDVEEKDDLSDSSLESLPEMEVSSDDVVSAIGPKHFWKARRAIVNQQRVFAVQVFELHRLIKVQKLIAASPHLLIEGDPCLGRALVASKKKVAGGNVGKQLPSTKNNDDVQPTLQQLEYTNDNTEGNRPSPTQDDVVGVQHDNQAATNGGAVSSNPPAMPTASDKQNSWCIPPPPNQWLVPVMSPSEGLVYKPYTGPCPPAGSFLAPFYGNCAPVNLPSTAGDFMNSAYGLPMPHQQQHMGVPGPAPMPPMYFPPFSMPLMNPAASASAVEQVSHAAVPQPDNGHKEQHSRNSCNMSHLRSEALSAGIWRFHASRDSELQGSSASSPFDRQQGEGRGPTPPIPASSAGNGQPQPSSGSRENSGRVIRVVPHTARTASASAARIFRSIQMERQQNDP